MSRGKTDEFMSIIHHICGCKLTLVKKRSEVEISSKLWKPRNIPTTTKVKIKPKPTITFLLRSLTESLLRTIRGVKNKNNVVIIPVNRTPAQKST
ncbi:hypothetical protein VCR17_19160, partial [Acinetobacter baumannii]|uniref:hypothetical protein n=4 Tax=Acinetobacter baumannii TaxID=470 RepID=UPI002FF1C13A